MFQHQEIKCESFWEKKILEAERIFLKKAQLRKPLRNLKMTVNRFNKADTLFITIGFVCLCVVFLSIVCMMGRKPIEID